MRQRGQHVDAKSVERLFAAIATQRIPVTVDSVRAGRRVTHADLDQHNDDLVPFVWTATADDILQRVCERMEAGMKSLLEEDPSELMGLEEENDPMEMIGAEDEEEDPRELMGLGEGEDEEEEPLDLMDDEEEDPAELLGLDEEDEDEEEDEGEEAPQTGRQRIPGLRLAQGVRAKRRARVIAVAALKARRRARLLALALVRRRRRGRLLALAALRARRRTRMIAVAALRARKRARALTIAAVRARRRIRLLKRAAIGARLHASA